MQTHREIRILSINSLLFSNQTQTKIFAKSEKNFPKQKGNFNKSIDQHTTKLKSAEGSVKIEAF